MTPIQRYHQRLREHGCMVTGRLDELQLHHVIGHSVTARIGIRGAARKASDWLVIPLHRDQHDRGVPGSLHAGIESWEERWGVTEAGLIDTLGSIYKLDLWALAAADRLVRKEKRQRDMITSKIIPHTGSF